MPLIFAIGVALGFTNNDGVSALPIAGILLGVGSANFSWLPAVVSHVMAEAGGSVFANMPLIFAIGVALGFTNNDGVSA
ncbi:hypothetical protein CQA18_26400, partial [Enterobacter hormaechei]|uniref:PTS transporter subunit EIIC n=1 Tax=Enterobacter hormaechei TaxID=158836 RepID=UPI000BD23E4C